MKKFSVLAVTVILAGSIAGMARPQDGRGDDGRFHDPETGEVQPDHCDNSFKNEHPCKCNHADEQCDHDTSKEHPSRICKTWCRTNACGCVNTCSS